MGVTPQTLVANSKAIASMSSSQQAARLRALRSVDKALPPQSPRLRESLTAPDSIGATNGQRALGPVAAAGRAVPGVASPRMRRLTSDDMAGSMARTLALCRKVTMSFQREEEALVDDKELRRVMLSHLYHVLAELEAADCLDSVAPLSRTVALWMEEYLHSQQPRDADGLDPFAPPALAAEPVVTRLLRPFTSSASSAYSAADEFRWPERHTYNSSSAGVQAVAATDSSVADPYSSGETAGPAVPSLSHGQNFVVPSPHRMDTRAVSLQTRGSQNGSHMHSSQHFFPSATAAATTDSDPASGTLRIGLDHVPYLEDQGATGQGGDALTTLDSADEPCAQSSPQFAGPSKEATPPAPPSSPQSRRAARGGSASSAGSAAVSTDQTRASPLRVVGRGNLIPTTQVTRHWIDQNRLRLSPAARK